MKPCKDFSVGDRVESMGKLKGMPKKAKGIVIRTYNGCATVRIQGSGTIVERIPFEKLKIPDVDKTIDTQASAATGVIDRVFKSGAYEQASESRLIGAVDTSMLPDILREYDQWHKMVSGETLRQFVVIIREFAMQFAYKEEVFIYAVRILTKVGNRDAIDALRELGVHPYTLSSVHREGKIRQALQEIRNRI